MLWFAKVAVAADPAIIEIAGDWAVSVRAGNIATQLNITPPPLVTVTAERINALPVFDGKRPGWSKGAVLRGVRTQETSAAGQLDPASLQLRAGAASNAPLLTLEQDYAADLGWGTIGRLPAGSIKEGQPVFASYGHGLSRIDAIVRASAGIVVRPGEPHITAPLPPEIAAGETRLANVWVPGRIARLGPEHLFPILETSYPEPSKPSPSVAEKLAPKTLRKLRQGERVRILAWGDSVTDAGYLPQAAQNRWQAQFVTRLRERFPRANVELVTEAWGGRNTATYLAEPPGSPHNYKEKVLDAKPDLVVSEFVNDAGLSPAQVEQRYSKLLADFQSIGTEWIILTPHYVRPDWMGLTRTREIDDDPRPYVAGLRQFAPQHNIALADTSKRWGRLWRQGIPYTTILLNAINHPDPRGMKLFADSLMELF